MSPTVPPLDIGCGTLLPVRWSELCIVYSYDRDASARNVVEDKPFEMHVLVATTRGRWEFRGNRGRDDVDPHLTVVGIRGDHYGCRHDRRLRDSNLIATLRPHALDDDDQPLFRRQTLPIDAVTPLRRAMAASSDDDFDSRVFEILDLISTHSLREDRPRGHGRLRMQRIKRFIEAHAYEEIAIAQIADCAGMSPFACVRQFKAHTGTTPHAYLSALRVRGAASLLRGTRLPVSEVGRRIGIRDPAYFSRWFTKETGVTPRRFREHSRDDVHPDAP